MDSAGRWSEIIVRARACVRAPACARVCSQQSRIHVCVRACACVTCACNYARNRAWGRAAASGCESAGRERGPGGVGRDGPMAGRGRGGGEGRGRRAEVHCRRR